MNEIWAQPRNVGEITSWTRVTTVTPCPKRVDGVPLSFRMIRITLDEPTRNELQRLRRAERSPKVRDRIEVAPDISEQELRELVLARDRVKAATGAGIRTVIVRAPKLVNVVPL